MIKTCVWLDCVWAYISAAFDTVDPEILLDSRENWIGKNVQFFIDLTKLAGDILSVSGKHDSIFCYSAGFNSWSPFI